MKPKSFNHQVVEERLSAKWFEEQLYLTQGRTDHKKVYVLGMFPYPSGEGLHVGHVRIYTACDVMARYLRMRRYDVLLPMGWDAFGLPAENAAIKNQTNPKKMVPANEANFKRQLQLLGMSYDWSREFSTTDPEYYKWTQWLFLQLYGKKNEQGERLVYREEVPINWCPVCKTGLANEEVLGDGTHERCGTLVSKKLLPQWVMRITDYADELLSELETTKWVGADGEAHVGLDWPRGILEMQKNWIGKKKGVKIKFQVSNSTFQTEVETFTTRVDTVFGATFVVVAPEVVAQWVEAGWKAPVEVAGYVRGALAKTEQQRLEEEKEKTGEETGLVAINPVNGEEVPVLVADYVLASVGTGAVMGVPAHDERDWEFAKKYGLEIRVVIDPGSQSEIPANQLFYTEPDVEVTKPDKVRQLILAGKVCYTGYGRLHNSGDFNGVPSSEAMKTIPDKFSAVMVVTQSYHLRDWVFSRQRYWGEPFPLVYCKECATARGKIQNSKFSTNNQETTNGAAGVDLDVVEMGGEKYAVVPVPEDQLPVELPDLESYEPTDTGESPLSRVKEWVETTCPRCGGPARRETDTMPNWAGSCWYFLQFARRTAGEKDPGDMNQDLREVWKESLKENPWLPVEWYLGGAEHAVLHLLYARFWVKVFNDLGLLDFREPFLRLRSVGMVLAEDGRKMSKSLGNVVNPDWVVDRFGADAVRIYEMFMGPWDQSIAWDTRALVGCQRLVMRVWELGSRELERGFEKRDAAIEQLNPVQVKLYQTIVKVGKDIEALKFNTAVAAVMEFINEWSLGFESRPLTRDNMLDFLVALAPLAPFVSEELYQQMQPNKKADGSRFESVHALDWPEVDESLIQSEMVSVVVQVNGKVRSTFSVESARVQQPEAKEAMVRAAKRLPGVRKWLEGKEVVKVIWIAPRKNGPGLVNLVVR